MYLLQMGMKQFWSQMMRLYWQELIHIKSAEDCQQVDKIKMHVVDPNDTGNSPNIKSLIYN